MLSGRFARRAATFFRRSSVLETSFSTASTGVEGVAQRALWAPLLWKRLFIAGPPVAFGSWVAASEDPKQRVNFATQFPLRLARDVAAVSAIAAGLPPRIEVLHSYQDTSDVWV
jgi:hypothetical protein